MNSNVARSTFCSLAILTLCPNLGRAEITEAEFHQLHSQLQPSANEPWRTIGWKISVLEAQKLAGIEEKPIFIWAMDGHPLGCT